MSELHRPRLKVGLADRSVWYIQLITDIGCPELVRYTTRKARIMDLAKQWSIQLGGLPIEVDERNFKRYAEYGGV